VNIRADEPASVHL